MENDESQDQDSGLSGIHDRPHRPQRYENNACARKDEVRP